MQKENRYLIIPNNKKINEYGNDSFILPLKDFSVGFDEYFSVDEINELSNKYNISVIINKFMHEDDLDKVYKSIISLNNIEYFFIEDFSLTNFIDKDHIVIFPNHIITNYYSINYLNDLGYRNVLVSNEVTFNELTEIKDNVSSNLFYMYISKNNIMYSKRELLSNYYKHYNINGDNKLIVNEEVSNHELLIKEEDKATTIFNNKVFCASKYLSDLKGYNLIINFSNIDDSSKEIILKNINNKDLYKLIDSDFYFLENKIMYKVGDLK